MSNDFQSEEKPLLDGRPLYGTEQEKQAWVDQMKRMQEEGTAGDYGVPEIYRKYFKEQK